MTWVLVRAPQGHAPIQEVFVNRRFHGAAGWTETPFQVAIGVNKFSLRSATEITAESVADCPDMPEDNPFLVLLLPMAAPKTKAKAKKARKKSARPKTKRPKAAKKAPRRKPAKGKKAPKRKTPARRKRRS
jgi:hypothetical protein